MAPTQPSSAAASRTWTISGWSAGRPFVAYTRATAAGFSASAASPYTVSVGSPTSPPARRAATARSTSRADATRAGTPAVWRTRPRRPWSGTSRSQPQLAAQVPEAAEPALRELADVDAVLLQQLRVLVGVDRLREVLLDELGLVALPVRVEEV